MSPRRRVEREESNARKAIGWAIIVVLIAALWYFVLPPQLGGRTTLLTTRGISMEPLLHDGDLAILRKQSSYKVGDIIEYHSTSLDAPLLHRVVAIESNGTFDTKGDNNDFIDLDHPRAKDVTGHMIKRYAGLGKHLGLLKSVPVRILGALLVGYAIYHMLTRGKPERLKSRLANRPTIKRRTRTSSSPSPAFTDASSPSGSGAGAGTDPTQPTSSGLSVARLARNSARGVFAIVAVVSLLLAFVGFSHPTKSSADSFLIYNMRGAFNYSANATGGDLVYRNGQVQTGDPVYLSMVNSVFLTYKYQLDTISTFKGSGTIRLDAVLSGSSGWSHPLQLTAETPFTGDTANANAVIDLQQLRALVQQITALTKVPDGNFTVAIQPTITIDGALEGQKIHDTMNGTLKFDMSNTIFRPQSGNAPSPVGPATENKNTDATTGLALAKGGQVTLPAGAPQQLRGLGLAVGVSLLRMVGVVGLLVGVIGFLLPSITGRLARRSKPELVTHDSELDRFQDLFVPVSGWGQVGSGSMIIDVPSLEDLARVAESHNTLILQETATSGNEVFLVNHRHLTYRYTHSPLAQAEQRFGVKPEDVPESQESSIVE